MNTPLLSIVGKSGAGKTTLLEKIIPELKQRGYRVATIKHHSHPGIEIDHPGKDTWRHAQAGSDHIIIASPDRIASIRRLDQEISLDDIVADIHNVDIILTEGYKRAGKPAIEVIRAENGSDLICSSEQLFAVASDISLDISVPIFDLEDSFGIVDLIEKRLLTPMEK